MALKDWMEPIMFRCRLRGSTMHSDTTKSRSTRKVLVTWGRHGAGQAPPGVPGASSPSPWT